MYCKILNFKIQGYVQLINLTLTSILSLIGLETFNFINFKKITVIHLKMIKYAVKKCQLCRY